MAYDSTFYNQFRIPKGPLKLTIDGEEIKRPSNFRIARYNITNLTRTLSGNMTGDLIAKKRKFFLTYEIINAYEWEKIVDLLWNTDKLFVTFGYNESNVTKSATVYVGEMPNAIARTGGMWQYRDVSFDLIEQ